MPDEIIPPAENTPSSAPEENSAEARPKPSLEIVPKASDAPAPTPKPVRTDSYIPPEEANELPPMEAEPPRPWWEERKADTRAADKTAVAYYRHSAQDKQKNSIQIQAEQVRAYAKEKGLRIIHEFADRGRSGLTAEGRPAFMKMMDWVRDRKDFGHVLVLDVSRWGRFQDTDLSGQYELDCRRAGKRVQYVDLRDLNDDTGMAGTIIKQVKRITSADESRTRSEKVFNGSVKVAEQGYRPGGKAPYGFTRALLNEQDELDRYLSLGEKKAIANWRTKLAPGDEEQVNVVQEIFARFVDEGLDERRIAEILTARGVKTPQAEVFSARGLKGLGEGSAWKASMVARILRDRQYAGSTVYNRTSFKLQTRHVNNPKGEWVVTPDAHPWLVPSDLFERAQARIAERLRRSDPAEMLLRLRGVYEQFGIITSALLARDSTLPSAGSYAHRFGSLPLAFQRLFAETVERATRDVRERIDVEVSASDLYNDYLVLGRKLSVLIQPSVPVPDGYGQYWVFRPDRRVTVDITLGVPLAGCDDGRILGYFPFTRLMMRDAGVRLRYSSVGYFALHGHDGLELLRNILL